MIRFNTKEVLKQAEEQKLESKPSPKIVIKKIQRYVTDTNVGDIKPIKDAIVDEIKHNAKTDIVNEAWKEYHNEKLEQKKLSSQVYNLVAQSASRNTLKEQYNKINESLKVQAELFDRARHIEQYGKPPEPVAPSIDILVLKDQRKKLVDLRCKLAKKLTVQQAKNPNKVAAWQLELDKANAEYALIDEKIKKLEGKA